MATPALTLEARQFLKPDPMFAIRGILRGNAAHKSGDVWREREYAKMAARSLNNISEVLKYMASGLGESREKSFLLKRAARFEEFAARRLQ
ncbi:MAG: hypothetical protein KGI00_04815 [Candidatus Micrarchaeota archaeon]|nr:hypothetical protein [Candidatus Micrarchaeota archaeon]MDE1824672.1 hypothetical protein [Candidatus Micrarchaeota archaeon]MDE1850022.1 hypothetical protein [Candidatus Micrarchaeota archaeon]